MNKLKKVKHNSFSHLTKLRNLHLSYNSHLAYVNEFAFAGKNQLAEVYFTLVILMLIIKVTFFVLVIHK